MAERDAVRLFVDRVVREVPAPLVQASLFGSKARGSATPASDVDVLLVFRWLPPDREPHAGMAERIADEVAARTGVPVTVWSVAMLDLESGCRTPMLVDALEDAIPIRCSGRPLRPISFGPWDALHCCGALLQRVAEGSAEFARCRRHFHREGAVRRARDDLVRMSTASLLLEGITRPRHATAVLELLKRDARAATLSPSTLAALEWAAASFAISGKEGDGPLPPPPLPLSVLARAVQEIRDRVATGVVHLHRRLLHGGEDRQNDRREGTRLALALVDSAPRTRRTEAPHTR